MHTTPICNMDGHLCGGLTARGFWGIICIGGLSHRLPSISFLVAELEQLVSLTEEFFVIGCLSIDRHCECRETRISFLSLSDEHRDVSQLHTSDRFSAFPRIYPASLIAIWALYPNTTLCHHHLPFNLVSALVEIAKRCSGSICCSCSGWDWTEHSTVQTMAR